MRTLIFEPEYLGHHYAHVAMLAGGLRAMGCEVTLATSAVGARSEEFCTHLGTIGQLNRIVLDGPAHHEAGVARRRHVAAIGKMLSDAIVRTRAQHVYVTDGTSLASYAPANAPWQTQLRAAGVEAETLIIGGAYFYPSLDPRSPWRAALRRWRRFRRLAREPWRTVFSFDPQAAAFGGAACKRLAGSSRTLPDPVQHQPLAPRAESRQKLRIPSDGRYLGVLGQLRHNKGVAPLLRVFRDCQGSLAPDDRLLLAGRCEPSIRTLVRDRYADLVASGRVVLLDRMLSPDEFAAAFSASDVVSALYSGHPYSSSVVTRAAAAGRPVVCADYGWCGDVVRRFGLGEACPAVGTEPIDCAQQLAGCVQRAFDRSMRRHPTEGAERFVRYNSAENFVAHWTARLRERIGLPAGPVLRWSQVCEAPGLSSPLRPSDGEHSGWIGVQAARRMPC